MFTNKYTLWFHSVNDEKWGIDSYTKVSNIKNMDDYLYTFKKINNITSGMFFLMKNNIQPIYEDKANRKGGIWTFKISKKVANDVWLKTSLLYCLNKLTNKSSDCNIINGISISPKINNCIFKIWINKSKNVNIKILKNNINYIYLNEALFRKKYSK